MSVIHDISPVTGLQPKAKYFEEVGDVCINVDGMLTIMDEAEPNDRIRAIQKAFRHHHAKLLLSRQDLTPEKRREEALFQALDSIGFKVSFTNISGTMED